MAFDDFDSAGDDLLENEDDLLDLAREETRAATRAAKPAPAGVDLDEDLFGFPVMDGAERSTTVASEISSGPIGALEEDIERITEQVNDLIDEDLFEDEDLEAVEVEASDAIADALVGDEEDDDPAASDVFDEEDDDTDEVEVRPKRRRKERATAAAATAAAAPVAAGSTIQLGKNGVWIAAAAAVFALALVSVVWVTGRGLQEALATRGDAAPATDDALQARIAALQAELDAQRQALATAIAGDDAADEDHAITVVRVEPEWVIERKLIRQAIAEGRYREARKRLFALQAVMDELDAKVRDELAPEVAFLIPETYRLQAEAQSAAPGGAQ